MLFNRKLNLLLDGSVAGPIRVSLWEVFYKNSASCDLMIPVFTPLGALWTPASFGGSAGGIPLSLQEACAWPTSRIMCSRVTEHTGTTWGKSCGGFICLISPQWQMGLSTGAWEVKSIHRHANRSGEHMQGFFWERQLRYPAAKPSVVHASPGCWRWKGLLQ